MKHCPMCREYKVFEAFNRMRRSGDGRQAYCRECQQTRQAAYRAKHREKLNHKAWVYQNANPDRRRSNHLKNRYGITLADVQQRLAEQGGVCKICGSIEPRGRGWHVDHDHNCCSNQRTCGRCVRGILCGACNNMLGLGDDDPALLRAGADYLEAHQMSAKV